MNRGGRKKETAEKIIQTFGILNDISRIIRLILPFDKFSSDAFMFQPPKTTTPK